MKAYPKQKPFRSKPYLKWLRERAPICPGFGPTEAHHLKLFKNGSVGKKPPDNDCIPVFWSVHHDIHQYGERHILLVEIGFTIEHLRKVADDYFKQWKEEVGNDD